MSHQNTLTKQPDVYNTITAAAAEAGDRPTIILADFDYTLCDQYTPVGRNHIPTIDPALVEAAKGQHVVIATGRRANNPAVPFFWRSGLLPPHQPAITENGGSLVFYDEGKVSFLDLVSPTDLAALDEARIAAHALAAGKGAALPAGQVLTLKQGRTMLLAQLQSEDNTASPNHLNQDWLATQLKSLITDPSLQVVNTVASVTVQHEKANKAAGFHTYLDLMGINRNDIFVIGMGDGPGNDADIFKEADLSIGFSEAVKDMVDISVEGPHVANKVFRAIGAATIKGLRQPAQPYSIPGPRQPHTG